jgi:hypothetical protein
MATVQTSREKIVRTLFWNTFVCRLDWKSMESCIKAKDALRTLQILWWIVKPRTVLVALVMSAMKICVTKSGRSSTADLIKLFVVY